MEDGKERTIGKFVIKHCTVDFLIIFKIITDDDPDSSMISRRPQWQFDPQQRHEQRAEWRKTCAVPPRKFQGLLREMNTSRRLRRRPRRRDNSWKKTEEEDCCQCLSRSWSRVSVQLDNVPPRQLEPEIMFSFHRASSSKRSPGLVYVWFHQIAIFSAGVLSFFYYWQCSTRWGQGIR